MNKMNQGPIYILNLTINTLINNPIVLYPIFLLSCIHLLFLEIIFFAPRFPLSQIFDPIIIRAANPTFMHYPYNYILLVKWYHGLETLLYILINCIFYAAVVGTISLINSNQAIEWGKIFKRSLNCYIPIVASMVLTVISLQVFTFILDFFIKNVLLIDPTSSFFIIKKVIIIAIPYLHMFFAALAVSIFAFTIPIIVIEEYNFINAVRSNFLNYGSSIGLVLKINIISSLLYLPFVLDRVYFSDQRILQAPERSVLLLILSIVMMLLIDVIQYTAITLCYLSQKEEQT